MMLPWGGLLLDIHHDAAFLKRSFLRCLICVLGIDHICRYHFLVKKLHILLASAEPFHCYREVRTFNSFSQATFNLKRLPFSCRLSVKIVLSPSVPKLGIAAAWQRLTPL